MATKKYSVLAVLDVLKLYSDEEHCLHITDIKKYIKEPPYKIDVSEKTIRSDLRALYDFGYDIRFANSYSRVMVHSDGTVLDSDIYTGCYLVGDVSDEDIEILHDALLSERFLPESKYIELVEVLKGISSTVDFDLNERVAVKTRSDVLASCGLYENMRIIRKAIVGKKMIAFKYSFPKEDLSPKPSKERTIYMSPGRVFNEGGVYYLAGIERNRAFSETFEHYIWFRIERMKNVEPIDDLKYDYYSIVKSGVKDRRFAINRFKLVPNVRINVTFKFPSSLAEQVIDYFGSKRMIRIEKDSSDEDNVYLANAFVPGEVVLRLAKMYAPDVEIVSPVELREVLKKDFAAAAKKHK